MFKLLPFCLLLGFQAGHRCPPRSHVQPRSHGHLSEVLWSQAGHGVHQESLDQHQVTLEKVSASRRGEGTDPPEGPQGRQTGTSGNKV